MNLCKVDVCDRKAATKGYCRAHYLRSLRGASLDAKIGTNNYQQPATNKKCGIDGCEKPHYAKGFCSLHWRRDREGTDMLAPLFTGPAERLKTSDGYITLHKDGKRVFEHREVMSGVIGRPLLPEENVHHLNGVRDDNDPENLELWSKSQPPGQRVVDKVKWAKEILELYKNF